MITGAHSIIFSKDADRDRAFLKDVLGLSSVDAGGGWLIFGLPPAEVAGGRPDPTKRLFDRARTEAGEGEAREALTLALFAARDQIQPRSQPREHRRLGLP
jgi:catechol 2,3-dioxygenase-like lactoylglutathione lyase family enzyme